MAEEKVVNTTKSMQEPSDNIAKQLEEDLQKAKRVFEKEKQVEVSIPKSLAKALGGTVYVAVNGVGVVLPVDGSKHKLPETLAKHAQDLVNNTTT